MLEILVFKKIRNKSRATDLLKITIAGNHPSVFCLENDSLWKWYIGI